MVGDGRCRDESRAPLRILGLYRGRGAEGSVCGSFHLPGPPMMDGSTEDVQRFPRWQPRIRILSTFFAGEIKRSVGRGDERGTGGAAAADNALPSKDANYFLNYFGKADKTHYVLGDDSCLREAKLRGLLTARGEMIWEGAAGGGEIINNRQ